MSDKKLDETKLRGWAKEAQRRIEALERKVEYEEVPKYDPVPYHPIPLKDRHEFYSRRDKLRQVQIWTSAGKDEQGNHLLCSLDWPGPLLAGTVYWAVHDMDNLEPFDEWLNRLLGEDSNEQ
jgi:hypothetical protein